MEIESKVGVEGYNNIGLHMVVVNYRNYDDIDVMFDDGYINKHKSFQNFKVGQIKNNNYPSVFGIGILGDKYKCKENGKYLKEYQMWANMLNRCYLKTNKHYVDCEVDENFKHYEYFYEWCNSQENWKNIKEQNRIALDKDILVKGNRIYSPDTCCIVPHNVNCIFMKHKNQKHNCPSGVTFSPKDNMYYSSCTLYGKVERNYFHNMTDAFYWYKSKKEAAIKKMAEIEYLNGNINKKCYDAMINYEVFDEYNIIVEEAS